MKYVFYDFETTGMVPHLPDKTRGAFRSMINTSYWSGLARRIMNPQLL